MGTYKTDQNIEDEDWAWRLKGSGLKMPFHYRVDADMKGGFTVSLNRLTRGDIERLLVFLRDHHEEWLQMSSRRGWSENMIHQFAVGDIVRLNHTEMEGEVIGLPPNDSALLHCRWKGDPFTTYVPARSVTLVRSAGEAQTDHPRKIET